MNNLRTYGPASLPNMLAMRKLSSACRFTVALPILLFSHLGLSSMNEPHDIPDINLWAQSVQAAVTAIRNAGSVIRDMSARQLY